MNLKELKNQNNVAQAQESDLNNLVHDELDTNDFEQGIELIMREVGLNEPDEYIKLSHQGLER